MKLTAQNNKSLFIILLALLAATPPLSTDMYLAAIPLIAESWSVGEELVNLTLVLWFAFFSVSTLINGSLSDKYGRKPVLLGGLFTFVAASYMCAAAQDVWQLIAFRILQGAGAGAPAAVVLAVIRDRFEGRERQQAFAYVMTIVALAPMVAPMIGALLLEFASWRFIFVTQGFLVTISFVLTFFIEETNDSKITTSLLKLLGRYTIHFKNRDFMFASLSMGLLVVPFYGFIAFSPIYYISLNGLSEKLFSIFFGLNALAFMIGARTSGVLVRKKGEKFTITMSIAGCITAGAGLLFLADLSYLLFALFMFVFALCTGISRPVSSALIVGLVKTDAGSASSFLVFYQFISGAVCMVLVTQKWSDPVMFFGLLTFLVSLTVMLLWAKVAPVLDKAI